MNNTGVFQVTRRCDALTILLSKMRKIHFPFIEILPLCRAPACAVILAMIYYLPLLWIIHSFRTASPLNLSTFFSEQELYSYA